MKKLFLAVMVVMAIVALGSSEVGAVLVFKDTFNTSSATANVNWQLKTRQTGGIVGGSYITYLEYGGTESGGPYDSYTQVNNADIHGALMLISN